MLLSLKLNLSMWYDKGHRLSIESSWLPPYLVEGRWLEDVKAGKITR
ncbi:TPA: hypothetical protein I7284_18455 [Vibrio parahaemolyticus]|nr:hypothetical protein [Vibrio parahaemolyticus]